LYDAASKRPGAETEPTTNSTPTGARGDGGSAAERRPAAKAWRSPASVAKPTRFSRRTKSRISFRSVR